MKTLAKLTRPSPEGIFPRKRLFCRLDQARTRPIIFITAPPGSGKTSLVTGKASNPLRRFSGPATQRTAFLVGPIICLEAEVNKKVFDPEKYDMAICPYCNGQGYIQFPNRQCCGICGGFGYIKKEGEKDEISLNRPGNQG